MLCFVFSFLLCSFLFFTASMKGFRAEELFSLKGFHEELLKEPCSPVCRTSLERPVKSPRMQTLATGRS